MTEEESVRTANEKEEKNQSKEMISKKRRVVKQRQSKNADRNITKIRKYQIKCRKVQLVIRNERKKMQSLK